MKSRNDMLREYDRQMLRSSFLSLFWNVITDRRKSGKFTLQQIADALGVHKSGVSRAFASPPNWTIDKIADMADAFEIDLRIEARGRTDNVVYTPSEIRRPAVTETRSNSSTIFLGNSSRGPATATMRRDSGRLEQIGAGAYR